MMPLIFIVGKKCILECLIMAPGCLMYKYVNTVPKVQGNQTLSREPSN